MEENQYNECLSEFKKSYFVGSSHSLTEECLKIVRNEQLDRMQKHELMGFAMQALRQDAHMLLWENKNVGKAAEYGKAVEVFFRMLELSLECEDTRNSKDILEYIGTVCEFAAEESLKKGFESMQKADEKDGYDRTRLLDDCIHFCIEAQEYCEIAKKIGSTELYYFQHSRSLPIYSTADKMIADSVKALSKNILVDPIKYFDLYLMPILRERDSKVKKRLDSVSGIIDAVKKVQEENCDCKIG